ncbi:hypothetical protein RJ55_04657 [Drechmeria coniospora]|nr:hypothetical protein RJ55_04657 [Drechmeria coniospora]
MDQVPQHARGLFVNRNRLEPPLGQRLPAKHDGGTAGELVDLSYHADGTCNPAAVFNQGTAAGHQQEQHSRLLFSYSYQWKDSPRTAVSETPNRLDAAYEEDDPSEYDTDLPSPQAYREPRDHQQRSHTNVDSQRHAPLDPAAYNGPHDMVQAPCNDRGNDGSSYKASLLPDPIVSAILDDPPFLPPISGDTSNPYLTHLQQQQYQQHRHQHQDQHQQQDQPYRQHPQYQQQHQAREQQQQRHQQEYYYPLDNAAPASLFNATGGVPCGGSLPGPGQTGVSDSVGLSSRGEILAPPALTHLPSVGDPDSAFQISLSGPPLSSQTFNPIQALSPYPCLNPTPNEPSGHTAQQYSDFELQQLYSSQQAGLALTFEPSPQLTMGGGDVFPPHSQPSAAYKATDDAADSSPFDSRAALPPPSLPLGTEELTLGSCINPEQSDGAGSSLEPYGMVQWPKTRSAFDDARRKETADTRHRNACLRCRVQKIRCQNDPENPGGECLACQRFSKTSRKTIHQIFCCRNKLTDAVLFRSGGLNLTARWSGTAIRDVSAADRISGDVRVISFTQGICGTPITIQVVKFNTRPGDVIARFWTVRDGAEGFETRRRKDLAAYCLVDAWSTASYFEEYVTTNAIPSLLMHNKPNPMIQPAVERDVINRTYIMAVKYYSGLEDEIEGPRGRTVNVEKRLLRNLFILWFAIRHTTGSAYICGDEKLGMDPETKDDTYPLFGKVSLPRMVIAQFDCITHTKILSIYGREVLKDLEALVFRNQPRWWWTIYFCFFTLLHQASFVSSDRYRHARNNYGAKYRYSIPGFVEQLHEGCNTILLHWHYYNCRAWPNPLEPWHRHKSFLSELSPEQHDLVMETMTDARVQRQLAIWKHYKDNNGSLGATTSDDTTAYQTQYIGRQAQIDWDHPLYWVAQMFEEQWSPHPTYQREYVE